MDIIRILLSILLPPLGVFLQVGIGAHFWINILLTILGYFPGVIHNCLLRILKLAWVLDMVVDYVFNIVSK